MPAMLMSANARASFASLEDEYEGDHYAMENDSYGICFKCGHVHEGIDTDDDGSECENCGAEAVHGIMYCVLAL